jgi:hypothetical protein
MKVMQGKMTVEVVGCYQNYDLHSLLNDIATEEQEQFQTLKKGYENAYAIRSYFLHLGAEVENDGVNFFVTMTASENDLVFFIEGNHIEEQETDTKFESLIEVVEWVKNLTK